VHKLPNEIPSLPNNNPWMWKFLLESYRNVCKKIKAQKSKPLEILENDVIKLNHDIASMEANLRTLRERLKINQIVIQDREESMLIDHPFEKKTIRHYKK